MAEPAIAKVEDALAEQLADWPALAAVPIFTDQSSAVAVDELDIAILVYTVAYEVDQADEQHQSRHIATIECEVISRTQTVGTINRANHRTIANIIGAVAADRTLGGRLLDIQEVDVAPAGANGKDVGTASLQFQARFYTPRDDWFTILGQAGQEF